MNKELYESYNILKKVYYNGAYASIELNKLIRLNKFELNTGLVTKIVYGVLEKDVSLTYVVSNFCKTMPEPNVLLILKIGAYVGTFINSIPKYACVNELVEITKKYENKYIAGFVNATLKSIINNKISLPDKKTNLVKYLSVKYSYPMWIVELLIKENGEEFTENLLSFSLPTMTHIRVNEKEISVKEFVEFLDKNEIEYINSGLNYTFYVDYEKLLKVHHNERWYAVQGLPSIFTCLALQPTANSLVLDACAAPGGKTVMLASMDNSVAITSCDKYTHRIELIKAYANKYGLNNINYEVADATLFNSAWENKFDFVLCDVPCSNLGIASKKPDILLNKSLESLAEINKIQLAIIENCSKYVKNGGVLLYSTCSIFRSENQEVIKNFLSSHSEFTLEKIDFNSEIEITEDNMTYTFYPHISKTEGFFIGRMRKNG